MYWDFYNDYSCLKKNIADKYKSREMDEAMWLPKLLGIYACFCALFAMYLSVLNNYFPVMISFYLISFYLFVLCIHEIKRIPVDKSKRKQAKVELYDEIRKLLRKYGIDDKDKEQMHEIIEFYSNIGYGDDFLFGLGNKSIRLAKTAIFSMITYIVGTIIKDVNFNSSEIFKTIFYGIIFIFVISILVYFIIDLVEERSFKKKYEDLAKELKQVYIFRNREYGEDENISNL